MCMHSSDSMLSVSKGGALYNTDAPREEQDVIERILERLQSIPELASLPAVPILGLQSALSTPRPVADAEQRTPLTW